MAKVKTNFAVSSKYEAFYTGGKIQISRDGCHMFCGCGNTVNVLEVETGKVHISIGEEQDEEISSFCITPDDQYLILASRNMLLRQWNWREKKLLRSWKAIHFAPVVSMTFDCTSTLLATGSADSTVKVWDIDKQYCTHNLRGHQGIVSVVAFHPDISRHLMYSAGEDYKIRVWNLANSKCVAEISAHFSLVTAIVFSKMGTCAYTSGRDGVVSVIDTSLNTVKKTIPVFEVVEALVLLPENQQYPDISVDSQSAHFITAGNKGILRLWNSDTGKCVFTTNAIHSKNQFRQESPAPKPENDDSQNIVQMVYNEAQNSVTVVTYDQNISVLSLDKLRLQKQFAGNNDEILDVKYFGEDGHYAIVATNSMLIKVFELANWDCEILYGHTDIVLCIDVLPKSDVFISGSKDNTVRLWKINPVLKQVSCLAVGQGHTSAVGTVAMSRKEGKFFVSGSEDCTLKLWNLSDALDPSVTMEIHATVTEKAHDKTISSIVVAPNDKFIASGSMDKTAKLWKASNLSLIGVMRGHKRGIWCVQFSPVDQILATSSGDGTVKLWSLTDFSCVRTFEGHDCAVLKVTFITKGMQLLSSGTNGLVKLWTIKSNECVKTLDEHEDKVWALAVGESDDNFLTGGADSRLIVWKDVTEIEQSEAREKQEQFILQEQELSNLIQQKKYLKAIGLAITLEQPFRLLNILKEILREENGDENLQQTLEKLRLDQIDALLRFSVQWNTNSRHCHEAQVMVAMVMKMYPPQQLRELGSLKASVEGLLPYTERHFNRLSRLVQQSMFLDYTWQCMKGISSQLPEEEGMNIDSSMGEAAVVDNNDTSTSESEDDNIDLENVTIKQKKKPDSNRNKVAEEKSEMGKSSSESEESSHSENETDFVIDRKGKPHGQKEEFEQCRQNKFKVSEITTSVTGNGRNERNSNRIERSKADKKYATTESDSDASSESSEEFIKTGMKPKVVSNMSRKVVENDEDSEDSSDSGADSSNENIDNEDSTSENCSDSDENLNKSLINTNEDVEHTTDSEDESEGSDSEDSSKCEPDVKKTVSVSSVGSEREIYRHIGMSERSVKTLHNDSSIFDESVIKSGVVSGKFRIREPSLGGKWEEGRSKAESSDSDQSESESLMEEESMVTPTGGAPAQTINTDNIKKKLFQSQLCKMKQKSKKGSAVAPKRKLTEAYTVVKEKTPRVLGLEYIDGSLNKTTMEVGDTKKKPRDLLAVNKLKKLKRPGRR